MEPIRIYFATNRNPIGNAEAPTGFGYNFSPNGLSDLRFGVAFVDMDAKKIVELKCLPDNPKDGSLALYGEIKSKMREQRRDTLIMIHGYNTKFEQAIIGAAQTKLAYKEANLNVVMFSWPSDGKLGPLNVKEYGDDRHDAEASGLAFCRGLMKLGAFLREGEPCGQRIFLLAHSMGNFVLRNTLQAMLKQSVNGKVSRAFDVILSMAADEDNDAFDREDKWARLPDLAGRVVVYCNSKDRALLGSEWTKGNPDRMGSVGPEKPAMLPAKVEVVDVTKLDKLFDLGHGYYDTWPAVINDVLQVMKGVEGENIKGRNWIPSKNKYCIG